MKKYQLFIALIALITILTRFVRLDLAPPHLSNDEISIAYDAYSISKTGRDYHNHYLPLSFQSHNTYKAPLTIYLSVPTTVILGNNDYSARLPSAFLGSLTVLFLGLLIYELTKNSALGLLGSLLLSITPAHIYSSRMALESNIALFFVTLGLYLFYHGLNRHKNMTYLASYLAFFLSLYAYHTEWGFTPLLLLSLWFFNWKSVASKKISFLGIGIFVLTLIPLFLDFLHNLNTNARANTEIILKDPAVSKYLEDASLNILQKSQVVLKAVVDNYSNYTNPSYIFFNGLSLLPSPDPLQVGIFLSPLILPFFIGLFNVKKYFGTNSKFIYAFALLSPIIPSLTWGGVSNFRNLISVAPYTILIAVGVLVIWNYLKNNKFLKIGSVTVLAVSFLYFLLLYFYHFPFENGLGFQYGYKQIAQFIAPRYGSYQKIVIDPRFGDTNIYSGLPSLYIPYYTTLDAHKLLESRDTKEGLFFDKYEIRNINWNLENPQKSVLYVVPVSNAPNKEKNLKKELDISLPNHIPAFEIYSY